MAGPPLPSLPTSACCAIVVQRKTSPPLWLRVHGVVPGAHPHLLSLGQLAERHLQGKGAGERTVAGRHLIVKARQAHAWLRSCIVVPLHAVQWPGLARRGGGRLSASPQQPAGHTARLAAPQHPAPVVIDSRALRCRVGVVARHWQLWGHTSCCRPGVPLQRANLSRRSALEQRSVLQAAPPARALQCGCGARCRRHQGTAPLG